MRMGNPQPTGVDGSTPFARNRVAESRQYGLDSKIDDLGSESRPQVFAMAHPLPLSRGLLATKMSGRGTRIPDTLNVILQPKITFRIQIMWIRKESCNIGGVQSLTQPKNMDVNGSHFPGAIEFDKENRLPVPQQKPATNHRDTNGGTQK